MKIAFFDNLPAGGAKRMLNEQIKGLTPTHTIISFSQSQHQPPQLGFRPLDDFIKILCSFLWQGWFAFQINHSGASVCVVHPDQYTEAPFILRFLTIKSIYYCHEVYRLIYDPDNRVPENWPLINKVYEIIYRGILRRIDAKNINCATRIVTNSQFTKRQIMKCYHLNSHVVYPGVDTAVFKPLNIRKKPYVIFMGGRTKLDGWDRVSKIRQLFLNKGISVKEVYFQKGWSDHDLALIYNEALCLLAFDRREPFGMKVLEALACGTDVIAISDGGYREIAKLYEQYKIEYFSWNKHNESLLTYC